jgi:hypothetical protein
VILLAFAVGQNNFGGGRTRMAELVPEIRRHLPAAARLLGSHGHSGNVAVDFHDPAAVAEALRSASGRDWAVVPADEVAQALRALQPVREAQGIRLTPGLAFRVGDGAVVPVTKRDVLDGTRLDSNRRDGGWGAISSEVSRAHPGRWTARSWRPVDGLLRSI